VKVGLDMRTNSSVDVVEMVEKGQSDAQRGGTRRTRARRANDTGRGPS
jgi:hypothetical protein